MTSAAIDGSFWLHRCLADAAGGDANAFFDLGMAYAAGRDGAPQDYVEAHKWFNLAALSGDARGQACRADLATEMSAREIAQAQRQARAWLMQVHQKAA